jgi:hypothetical protein
MPFSPSTNDPKISNCSVLSVVAQPCLHADFLTLKMVYVSGPDNVPADLWSMQTQSVPSTDPVLQAAATVGRESDCLGVTTIVSKS